MKSKSKKKSKNGLKITIAVIVIIIFASIFMISMGASKENVENISEVQNKNTDNINLSNGKLNTKRIMRDGSYQIRFSDLVSLDALEVYKDKTVTAIGYLSPIGAYDGSFTYLMNLPYQTCPYCLPSDTKITNTLAIFAKNGNSIEFTEAAVMVRGTLKLEPYTDEYGYSYNYRLVDVEIEEADTSELGEKIALYNEIAEKEILTRMMESLYAVDDNIFYDQYIANGYEYERQIVDTTVIDELITDLETFNKDEVKILIDTAKELKEIATETNKLMEEEKYDKIADYQEKTEQLFYSINDWMGAYEL